MTFTAGAAESVITPPIGTQLQGYGRAGKAVAVHDDLHARAVVVDDGDTRAAIVSCDLIAIDRRLSTPVRAIVHQATGIAPDHIMICATHTHAGPPGIGPGVDEDLRTEAAHRIAGAIIEASRAMRPAVLKAGRGIVDSVSQNRREPSWPRDDSLSVLLFDAADPRETPIASIINFACHATVLFEDNLEISADYPGYATAAVRKMLGEAPVLFLQGACGDVNPAWMEQKHHEARRVGSIVGSEAARRLLELRPLGAGQHVWNIRWDEVLERPVQSGRLVAQPRIRAASRTVDVAMRVLEPPETYDAEVDELTKQRSALARDDLEGRRRITERLTMLQGTRAFASALRPGERHVLHPELQAISLGGGCAVVGLPGEFFAETGLAIREAASLPHLMVACYTNHNLMYVVPKHAFAEGGYEPGVAILDEEAEAIFRRAAIDLLNEVNT
jgi:hypothetical protein